MPKLVSIAVENSENYLQEMPLRLIAIDADGGVWRGTTVTAPLAPTVITWQPVACEFPGRRDPQAPVTFEILPAPHREA